MTRRTAVTLALGALALGACGTAGRAVRVLYAASLTALMEGHVGPAFARATRFTYQGYAAGSTELAQEIAGGVRAADVFVSASPTADERLAALPPGRGHVAWYAQFAHSPLVLAYAPSSRFAAALGTGAWYDVVLRPGFRLGRTDPKLDPKGALVIQLAQAQARAAATPGLDTRLLAAGQLFPEEALVGRLQAGQLDGGFLYQSEAVTAKLPFVTPDPAVDPSAQYTLALPAGAPNPAGAVAFAGFLLGTPGRPLLTAAGLVVGPVSLHGDTAAVPGALRPVLGSASTVSRAGTG